MSIAALEQVQDELRRLGIAGSGLAPGDFRLKKLIPPLEKSGAKAPVFAKIAETTTRLVDGTEKEAANTLLELGTLVGAVLYTQGATGAKGKLQPIETTTLGPLTTGTSARVLKPLVEALTTTGSGRLELVRDAVERNAFNDLRLVNPALVAVDDPYPEIAELVCEKVLPAYGKAIYDQVREGFDHTGRAGHVRRLKLMHAIDPKATRDLVERSLESGSKEMKVAALVCLKGSKDGLPHLLEQVTAKAKDVRAAALEGMSETKHADVTEAFKAALTGKDVEIAARPASRNPDAKLLKWLLEEGRSQLEALLTTKTKSKLGPLVVRFHTFLTCFHGRTDKQTVAFLGDCFDRREDLAGLASKDHYDGDEIVWKVAGLLCHTNAKAQLKRVADAHATLPPSVLSFAMVAAAITSKPDEVFTTFSPYLLAKKPKGKRGDQTAERRQAVRSVLAQTRHYEYWRYADHDLDLDVADRVQELTFDERWLDTAVEIDDVDLVITLLRKDHAESAKYLESQARKLMKRRDADWELMRVLEAMLDAEHPRATELYLETLEKFLGKKSRRVSHGYYGYWYGRLIPKLPKSAVPDLEALLPHLHDNAVDAIADQVVELKSKE